MTESFLEHWQGLGGHLNQSLRQDATFEVAGADHSCWTVVSWLGVIDSLVNVSLNLIKYGNAFWTGIILEKDRKSGIEAINRPCMPGMEHWQRY